MSSASTSRPDFSETFLYLMRAPVFASSWLKWMAWSRTAAKAFTGIVTRPKLSAPDQIGRAIGRLRSIRGRGPGGVGARRTVLLPIGSHNRHRAPSHPATGMAARTPGKVPAEAGRRVPAPTRGAHHGRPDAA